MFKYRKNQNSHSYNQNYDKIISLKTLIRYLKAIAINNTYIRNLKKLAMLKFYMFVCLKCINQILNTCNFSFVIVYYKEAFLHIKLEKCMCIIQHGKCYNPLI